ncbi:hypothetical protein UlMin_026798 [Ulmus minor]
MEIDSEEEMNEEYVEQATRNDMELGELVLLVAKHRYVITITLRRYGLISSKGVRLEELIGFFLMILGHGVGIRVNKEQFQHSGKTDYIGAIDETHIHAKIHLNEQIPYIGRKGFPTQNIMDVCDFNMLFTFVWPGWEGSAHDTCIFLEALRNPDIKFPKPPPHSSLRSVIERCFGVWKARWQILADMPRYKFDSPVAIIMISMALQNL